MADFREAFERVRNLVVMGNAHLDLLKGLRKRLLGDKRLVVNTAPTFFGLTLESHLDAALLYAAKIFDTHRRSLNLRTILAYADANKNGLSAESASLVKRAVDESWAELTKLDCTLNAVRTRRDKLIAHLDPVVVSRPDEIAQQSQITVDELHICASLKLLDVDDFEHALSLIEEAKHRQTNDYEA